MSLVIVSPFERYQELQRYVGWTPEDAQRIATIAPLLTPFFPHLIDDFYAEIENHPEARRVITGGEAQIARLRTSLRQWLAELLSGDYGREYVERRWKVGLRHVEIGLHQVYANAALSRLRFGLLHSLTEVWTGEAIRLLQARESLNRLLDLDLALIEDAYQTEFLRRQAISERLVQRRLDEREIDRLSGEVAASEEQYRQLFESTLDGLIAMDANGQILAANPAACAIVRQPCEALLGRPLASLTLALDGQACPARWEHFYAPGKDRGEHSLQCSDATVVEVEYRSVADYTPGRNLISLRDVSDRKRAEERARQASRLAAIGETMAALVHDSRNALQRCKANLEMLSLEVEDRPEAIKLVSRVAKAQEDLHKLFEEVRQWAAPLVLQREPCNLRQLWREVWSNVIFAHSAKNVRLDEHCSQALHVLADRFALAQVFCNVFENAVEAAPPGTAIDVACQDNPAAGTVLVSIRDGGPGLSADQQRRIFEPFYTTKSKGTGLGMAIASRIVHAHGGTIAASSPGGAQIEITLPASTP